MAVGTTAFPTSLDTVVELVEITNNASSTLSGNVLIGDTTIGVVDIAEFPTTGYGTIVDDLTSPSKVEIISWTGKSGSNLTGCTRGTQGTSAAAFSSGNYIEVRPTAGHHEALRGAVIAIETKLGTGSTIAVNKLAALTASKAVVTDASGFLASATVTAAEIGYLAGVTTPTGSGALVLATSPTLTTPTIAKLANLTSNGFVKTSGGDGTLSVDTSTYLTANQTITLSGDVTGSGTTGITTTIASGAVTYAKMQNISATQRVLGRNTAGAGSTEEVTITQFLDWAGTAAQGDILYRGASSWALLAAGTNGHYLKTQGAGANPVWAAVAGGGLGDVVGPGSATDNAVVRFDSTTGKLVQDSVVTIADTTGNIAGVGTLNGHTLPAGTDTFVLLTANQTLTTKTLTSPDINGGTADSLTSLSVRSTGAAFDLLFANTEVLTGNKTLTVKVNDASRTIDLAGNLTLAAAFSTSGANALTLTTTGATNVTLPTSGTLAIVGGTLAQFAATTSSQLAGVISDETGSGSLVFGTAPTFASTIAIGTAGGTTGAINLNGTTSGTVTLKVADVAGTYTLTLPANDGDASQFLQTDGAGNTTWATGGGGLTIGTTAITSGTAGRILYETAGNVVGEIAGSSVDANGAVQFAATARTSGVAQYFRINTPADTGQTTATESVGAYFGGNGSGSTVTRTWAAGTVATQRENVFVAPTYAGASATATFTRAATVEITGNPAGGANAAITNGYALVLNNGGRYLQSYTTAESIFGAINGSGTVVHYVSVDANSGFQYVNVGTIPYFTMMFGNSVKLKLAASSSTVDFGSISAHPLTFYASNAEAARLTTNKSLLINSTTENAQLYAVSGSASRVALRVDSAATPSASVFSLTNNGTEKVAVTKDFYQQFYSIGTSQNFIEAFEGATSATQTRVALKRGGLDFYEASGSVTNTAGLPMKLVSGNSFFSVTSAAVSALDIIAPDTTSVFTMLTLARRAAGATSNGVGAALNFQVRTSASDRDAATVSALWSNATDASRTSALTFSTVNNAGALTEVARIDGPGRMAHNHVYGGLYEDGGSTAITITSAGTYYQWATSTAGLTNGITASTSSDNLTVDTGYGGTYLITLSVSFSGTGNATVKGAIYVNGARLANGTFIRKLGSGGDIGAASIQCIAAVTAGQAVDLRFTSDSNGDSVTPSQVNLTMTRIGS